MLQLSATQEWSSQSTVDSSIIAHLFVKGVVSPDYELSAHCIQHDRTQTPFLLDSGGKIAQRLLVILNRSTLT